jgi:hypothetical protein
MYAVPRLIKTQLFLTTTFVFRHVCANHALHIEQSMYAVPQLITMHDSVFSHAWQRMRERQQHLYIYIHIYIHAHTRVWQRMRERQQHLYISIHTYIHTRTHTCMAANEREAAASLGFTVLQENEVSLGGFMYMYIHTHTHTHVHTHTCENEVSL